MTDRPILFSAPMVRALLSGTKTQTRRVAKLQPSDATDRDVAKAVCWPSVSEGDRLWVRESVRCGAFTNGPPSTWSSAFYRREHGSAENPAGLWYEADGLAPSAPIGPPSDKLTPSIFMPRWASRLTLHVTDVRVQRLNEISPADAIAEGIEQDARTGGFWGANGQGLGGAKRLYTQSWRAFADLWDSLNADRGFGWAENPWVVATTFSVQHGNIDQLPVRSDGQEAVL